MVNFTNPFFSIAGQKERLSTVANNLKLAVTLQGLSSEKLQGSSNKAVSTIGNVISTLASNPYFTALPLTAVSKSGQVVASTVGKSVTNTIVNSSLKSKIITGAVASTFTGALISSSQVRQTTSNILQDTYRNPFESTYNFGSNVGKVIENPSFENVKEVYTDNPIIAGAVTLVLGKTAVSGATAVNNLLNSNNDKLSLPSSFNTLPDNNKIQSMTSGIVSDNISTSPVTANSSPINTTSYNNNVSKRKTVKRKPQSLNIRINNNLLCQA